MIGKRYSLKLMILHGSYAIGKEHQESDIDIAVVGYKKIDFKKFLELYGELAEILGDNKGRELDLKTLQGVDPFFRYMVVRDGTLLYGESLEYEEFKAYAFRDFMDTKDLRRLELSMTLRKQQILTERYS